MDTGQAIRANMKREVTIYTFKIRIPTQNQKTCQIAMLGVTLCND